MSDPRGILVFLKIGLLVRVESLYFREISFFNLWDSQETTTPPK